MATTERNQEMFINEIDGNGVIHCRSVGDAFSIGVMKNGSLKLTANNTGRRWLKQEKQKRNSEDLLWEILEPCWANGSYAPFNAGDANPFVGLSSAPCIAESMDVADDGTKTINGDYWFFENYMLENFVDTLMCTGRVLFTSASCQ